MRELWIGTVLAITAATLYSFERYALILARSIAATGGRSPLDPEFKYLASNVAVWALALGAVFFFYRGLRSSRGEAAPHA
jgi:hypothetical protein